jgi:hypothetical protein
VRRLGTRGRHGGSSFGSSGVQHDQKVPVFLLLRWRGYPKVRLRTGGVRDATVVKSLCIGQRQRRRKAPSCQRAFGDCCRKCVERDNNDWCMHTKGGKLGAAIFKEQSARRAGIATVGVVSKGGNKPRGWPPKSKSGHHCFKRVQKGIISCASK